MPPLHIIDFEGSLHSGIVEYGVCTLEPSGITGLHTRLCRPSRSVSQRETAVHGLDDRSLAASTPVSEDWDLFTSLRRTGVFAAHGAGTEASLLRAVWPYPGSVPDWSGQGRNVVDWGPWIDTERVARSLAPHAHARAGGTLGSLIEAVGLMDSLEAQARILCPADRRRWHCAPYDALATALLLAHLLQNAPETTCTTLLHLSLPASARADWGQGELML